MSKMKITKWNMAGFEEIRRSPGVQSLVDQHASAIAARAGEGFEWDSMQGKSRFRGIVYTATFKARLDNARHNTLLKAVGS